MEEKVSLKRNEIFIAHNKCVYAGSEVSENNVRVLGSLEDKVQNTKKNIVDLSICFNFTFDIDHFGPTARKAFAN